ncbi:MAG: cation diffusion facilitator family transporter [bacterium]
MKEINYQRVKKVSFISIIVNVLLSILKTVIGFFFHSQGLIADGFHSLSDIFSTIIILISSKYSKAPPDQNHPYGHGKAESVGVVVLSFFLFFTGAFLIKNTLTIIVAREFAKPSFITLWIALASIVVKEGLYQYSYYVGKKISHKGLIADAYHHRSDALSSVAVLIGIIGARLDYAFLDPLAALIVAFLIIKIAIKIFKEALNDLMDAASEEVINEIELCVQEKPEVIAVKDVKIRAYGAKLYVDLIILVDGSLTVLEGHDIAAQVKKLIKKQNEKIKDVLIHVDPE